LQYTAVDLEDFLMIGKMRFWLETRLANTGFSQNFDITRDGKRIATLMSANVAEGQKDQNHVIFLLNFFDELRRRVSAGAR
jgi:hypothetical protein